MDFAVASALTLQSDTSRREPCQSKRVAMMVRLPPSSMCAPRRRKFGTCNAFESIPPRILLKAERRRYVRVPCALIESRIRHRAFARLTRLAFSMTMSATCTGASAARQTSKR